MWRAWVVALRACKCRYHTVPHTYMRGGHTKDRDTQTTIRRDRARLCQREGGRREEEGGRCSRQDMFGEAMVCDTWQGFAGTRPRRRCVPRITTWSKRCACAQRVCVCEARARDCLHPSPKNSRALVRDPGVGTTLFEILGSARRGLVFAGEILGSAR